MRGHRQFVCCCCCCCFFKGYIYIYKSISDNKHILNQLCESKTRYTMILQQCITCLFMFYFVKVHHVQLTEVRGTIQCLLQSSCNLNLGPRQPINLFLCFFLGNQRKLKEKHRIHPAQTKGNQRIAKEKLDNLRTDFIIF